MGFALALLILHLPLAANAFQRLPLGVGEERRPLRGLVFLAHPRQQLQILLCFLTLMYWFLVLICF